MRSLLPLFLDLAGRRVLLVGGGTVAAAKLDQLLAARADVFVVAPEVCSDIVRAGVPIERRRVRPEDLDHVWLVVAAATPAVNREIAEAAGARQVFVNAVDDPANATAFMGGVVRRDGVTVALSTSGDAPALASLLRQAIEDMLPRDLGLWMREARRQRAMWRRDGVPMNARRPLLLRALNALYERSAEEAPLDPPRATEGARPAASRIGRVALVGAGPGDSGLLTRRAAARLRGADMVLYDALIDRRILKLARRAQRFFVGKRAGRHAMTQHAINAVMIRAARRGKYVVRLKGGDPFVFGRGGEEAAALRAAAVPVEIVPGVTSATAAPALADIPVTHRGVASALLVVGGHDEHAFASAIRGVAANETTLVILMGVGRRGRLARRLIESGWDQATPAAIVVDASMPGQTVWRGTLDALAHDRVVLDSTAPGTIVVGRVAACAAQASGRDAGPLDEPRAMTR